MDLPACHNQELRHVYFNKYIKRPVQTKFDCVTLTNQLVFDKILLFAQQSRASKFVLHLTYISCCYDTALNEFFVQITANFNFQVE